MTVRITNIQHFCLHDGPGIRTTIFLKGCNLTCPWCANPENISYNIETYDKDKTFGYDISLNKLKKEILKDKTFYSLNDGGVTFSGGEPLLQKDIDKFIELILADGNLRVEIETNGSVDISKFKADGLTFTMDYKLPSSGCEDKMNLDNFTFLKKKDTVKFVSGSTDDLNKALDIIRKYDLINKCHVYFSPVFGKIEPREIVDFMVDNNLNDARVQIQMHKVIWDPNQKGV